jgi:hypothetical protein
MKTNNTTLKSRNTSVMAGIDKHITTSITINGTTFTQADLKAVFQSQLTAIATNEALHKSLADGVVNARANFVGDSAMNGRDPSRLPRTAIM